MFCIHRLPNSVSQTHPRIADIPVTCNNQSLRINEQPADLEKLNMQKNRKSKPRFSGNSERSFSALKENMCLRKANKEQRHGSSADSMPL